MSNVFTTLLPPNASTAERVLEQSVARSSDINLPIATLYNPELCPAHLLPWLAWALSVEQWDQNAPESIKREIIKTSVEIHRKKGTVGSVKKILASAGFPDAVIVENNNNSGSIYYNASVNHDSSEAYSSFNPNDNWAVYNVVLPNAITNKQARIVKRLLAITAPARCHLAALDYTEFGLNYDGFAQHNSLYNYGGA